MPKYTPTDQDLALLDKHFTYHPPKEDQTKRYEKLRYEFKETAIQLLENCPSSRERSVAMTYLETAAFWANAAIARNE